MRLDPLVESDLPDLATLLVEPAVYSSGYVMHRQPNSLADALALARQRTFAADPPNGVGFGRIAFTVRLTTDSPLGEAGTVVGTSSLGDAHLANESIHLGWTLYGPRWWGTKVNPEAKYLLLRHCFEDLGCVRVEFKTDSLNERSRAALLRIGAVEEGTFRNHMICPGPRLRHSVYFSVIDSDWPAVKRQLEDKLAR